MGGSASSPEARVSREYRRREAERARRIMDPRRYGSPDELPETESAPPVRTTAPAPQKVAPSPEREPQPAPPQPEQPAPPQPAPGGPPSGMVLIALQVPAGCQPGQIISAQHHGQTIQVACPPGCPPGATFQVQVPASQPVLAQVVTT